MSTISEVREGKGSKLKILTKGAPEIVQHLLKEVPNNYEEYYSYYVKHGYRVIAMAHKTIPDGFNTRHISRENAEKDLEFAGFLIFQCPMKEDTIENIQKILDANCKVKIITGDNVLTAAFVALKLGISRGCADEENKADNVVFARIDDQQKKINWVDYDENCISSNEISSIKFDSLEKMAKSYILCLEGKELDILQPLINVDDISHLILNIHVFARTSPVQKDYIIRMINRLGKYTAMCGDGTNDVGSLKSATVGIAVLNNDMDKKKQEENKEDAKEENKVDVPEQPKLKSPFYWPTPEESKMLSFAEMRKKQIEHMKLYQQQNKGKKGQMNLDFAFDSHITELGDACIAAPFTYKFSSVN
jgi:manganese-transporting P-type ATPase